MDPTSKENVAFLNKTWDAEKDEKLLHVIAHGNAEEQNGAFEVFYRRHSPYFYGICHDVVNRYKIGLCEVDDLFQETMLKVRRHANTFKMENFTTNPDEMEYAADAWMGGIAENIVKDWLSARPLCVSLDSEEFEEDEVCLALNGSSCEEDSEDSQLLRQALETLTPREQQIIWAVSQFYKRGKHQHTPTKELDEIVRCLQMSRDNFRKIRERARNKIRAYIAKHKTVPLNNERPRQIRIA